MRSAKICLSFIGKIAFIFYVMFAYSVAYAGADPLADIGEKLKHWNLILQLGFSQNTAKAIAPYLFIIFGLWLVRCCIKSSVKKTHSWLLLIPFLLMSDIVVFYHTDIAHFFHLI